MRGLVDFYYWRGVPVARQWPRRPNQPNSPAQLDARARLRDANAYARAAPASWHLRWQAQPSTPGRSYRDQYISCLLRTLAFGPCPSCPDISGAYLLPPDGILPQLLQIDIANPTACAPEHWRIYARAQPPGQAPIAHYDSGWYVRRCKALYKLYRPMYEGFKEHSLHPSSTGFHWRVAMFAHVDAVSYALMPALPGLDAPAQADMLLPPLEALPYE